MNESQPIKIGDYILLLNEEEEEDGFLSSGGYKILIVKKL